MSDTPTAGEIFARYAPLVRRFLANRVAPDEVDDLLSAVFERVVRRIASYEERGHPITAWLYSIARGKLIDRIRSNGLCPTWPIEEWSASVDGPEDLVLRAHTHEWMRTQIRIHLHGQEQRVIWLRFVADLSLAETAQTLGMTIGAVKATQFRGIAKLRLAIAPDDAPPMMVALAAATDIKP